ncbi:MAG: type II toxin-antitoxin system VapC family toxin [Pseudonocardia sp.]
MQILFDTNALLWLLAGSERLGPAGRDVVRRADRLVVSVATLWEVAIKVSLRKLAPIPRLGAAVQELGFDRLDIRDAHLHALEELPLLHRDPFDRLLISQARVEGCTILTSDRVFADYGAAVVDAAR